MMRRFLLLITRFSIAILTGCDEDERQDQNPGDLTCFDGNIVLWGNNMLDTQTKIGAFWTNAADDNPANPEPVYFNKGNADIDLESMSFKLCLDATNVPIAVYHDYEFVNDAAPLEYFNFNIGMVVAYKGASFTENMSYPLMESFFFYADNDPRMKGQSANF